MGCGERWGGASISPEQWGIRTASSTDMASRADHTATGSGGDGAHCSLIILLLSVRGVLPSRTQAADTGLGVMTPWRKHTSQDLSWKQPELTVTLPRACQGTERRACPPGRKACMVDENLVFHEEWELGACVDEGLLDARTEQVDLVPFTYQQLDVFKRTLDKVIHKWNVTSLKTVKSPLKVSKGHKMDAQVAALTACYLMRGGRLDKAPLDTLATFQSPYLCFLSPERLGSVQGHAIWAARPQDLDTRGPQQMEVLYCKAHIAFQNMSGSEYFVKIAPYLRGSLTEDLKALSRQNINMDVATFRTLQTEAMLLLTIAKVRKLLGPNLPGLKAEEGNGPTRDWIFRQSQDDLDRLGLGLCGGIPNGYLVLDLHSPEALSGGHHLLGPGRVLTAVPTLLLALVLN
ncbi:mesothelin [Manis javanica]|uniref:mesothelin n=1 Tax=Manis javanica TaxID=9974 RepID=UPI003C6D919B